MKTVKVLADELHVSVTTIRNYLQDLSVTKGKNNAYQIDEHVENLLKDKVQKRKRQRVENKVKSSNMATQNNDKWAEKIEELEVINQYLRDENQKKEQEKEALYVSYKREANLNSKLKNELAHYKK